MKVNKKMHSYSLDWQEAKAIVEVLYEGMPDGQIKRNRLARLAWRLREKFEIEER
jgi:hypothetical protein